MLLVLTDVLTCPRCGPDFGLVILADQLQNRRVVQGSLGCANCRELLPIQDGLADLRFPAHPLPGPNQHAATPGAQEPDEAALRLAALLGVTGGPGLVLVAGEQAGLAGRVAELVPDIGAVAVGSDLRQIPDEEGVSRILSERRLPLRAHAARGVALTGTASDALLEEGVRVLAPGGRLVLEPAPADARHRLESLACPILLEQDDVVVASNPGHR
jgi:uncharacterized protein YbaR (Trm112 family)